jgi:hypothetical protein
MRKEPANLPPLVPYTIPIIGHTIQFGTSPVELLMEGYKKVRALPFPINIYCEQTSKVKKTKKKTKNPKASSAHSKVAELSVRLK